MTIGIVWSPPSQHELRVPGRDDDIHLETHQFRRKLAAAVEPSLGIAPVNDDIFPLDVSKLAQP